MGEEQPSVPITAAGYRLSHIARRQTSCDECGGRLVFDERRGELWCRSCWVCIPENIVSDTGTAANVTEFLGGRDPDIPGLRFTIMNSRTPRERRQVELYAELKRMSGQLQLPELAFDEAWLALRGSRPHRGVSIRGTIALALVRACRRWNIAIDIPAVESKLHPRDLRRFRRSSARSIVRRRR